MFLLVCPTPIWKLQFCRVYESNRKYLKTKRKKLISLSVFVLPTEKFLLFLCVEAGPIEKILLKSYNTRNAQQTWPRLRWPLRRPKKRLGDAARKHINATHPNLPTLVLSTSSSVADLYELYMCLCSMEWFLGIVPIGYYVSHMEIWVQIAPLLIDTFMILFVLRSSWIGPSSTR